MIKFSHYKKARMLKLKIKYRKNLNILILKSKKPKRVSKCFTLKILNEHIKF